MDPCGATLVPGTYDTSAGNLVRNKSEFEVPAVSQGTHGGPPTCGYCIWFPDFSNVAFDSLAPPSDGLIRGNLFFFSSPDPSEVPVNIGVNKYGSGDPGTARQLNDPSANFVYSTSVSTARPIAACMEMLYSGTVLDSAGEVAYLENISVAELLGHGDPGSAAFTPSVNAIMAMSVDKRRLGTEALENVARLNQHSSSIFRPFSDSATSTVFGDAATISSETVSSTATDPRGFGFVWRHALPAAGITFTFTKCIEWKPDASSGFSRVPIKSNGRSILPTINAVIDKFETSSGKSIWHRVKGTAMNLGRMALKHFAGGGTFGGIMNAINPASVAGFLL